MNELLLSDRWDEFIPQPFGRLAMPMQVAFDRSHGDFRGVWRSQGGSIYLCDGSIFVCIAVHSTGYRGWLNKVAVKNLQRVDGDWVAQQAFRNPISGELTAWVQIRLQITRDVISKYFPPHVLRENLVYGYRELYYRVREC